MLHWSISNLDLSHRFKIAQTFVLLRLVFQLTSSNDLHFVDVFVTKFLLRLLRVRKFEIRINASNKHFVNKQLCFKIFRVIRNNHQIKLWEIISKWTLRENWLLAKMFCFDVSSFELETNFFSISLLEFPSFLILYLKFCYWVLVTVLFNVNNCLLVFRIPLFALPFWFILLSILKPCTTEFI